MSFRQIISLACVLCLVFGLAGCGNKKPVKIGFVGPLTGRVSDLGVSGRNGVMLAVEEINETGGIKGRPVELIVKDDRQDPHVALKVDQDLIKENVIAIIGHMTSNASQAVIPLINRERVLMISPTSSANSLSSVDDFFIRVTTPSKSESDYLSQYAYNAMGLRELVLVYDKTNRAYAGEWVDIFKFEFEKMGGKVKEINSFTSGNDVSFTKLTSELLAPKPEGIVIVAGSVDTAMICQQIRKSGSQIPIISSNWAMTKDFLRHGGPAVEGVIMCNLREEGVTSKAMQRFKNSYKVRFGVDPDYIAIQSYEAAQVLFTALKESHQLSSDELKAAILKERVFQGLYGDIEINEYGDPKRQLHFFIIKDGKFRRMF